MASYIVTERPRGSGSAENDGEKSSRESSRFFHVVVEGDATGISETSVRAFAPLPAIGVPHPSDPGLFCRRLTVEQVSTIFYEVEAEYTAPSSDPNDSPTLQPAVLRWGHVDLDEEIDQDADGKAIMTVAGESFDPPIRRQFGDLQLTYERNVIFFDPILATDYKFTVNSDTFLGFMPGQVLCTQFSGELVNTYWRRTIAFQFRSGAPHSTPAKAWYRRIRAEGYMILSIGRGKSPDPNKPVPVRALDAEGLPVVKPVLHNINTGAQIDKVTDAQWYEFKVYKSRPFAMLLTI